MKSLYPQGSKTLCITFEYDDSLGSGPPFSVSAKEVEASLKDSFEIKILETTDEVMSNPRLKEEGCERVKQAVLLLEKRS